MGMMWLVTVRSQDKRELKNYFGPFASQRLADQFMHEQLPSNVRNDFSVFVNSEPADNDNPLTPEGFNAYVNFRGCVKRLNEQCIGFSQLLHDMQATPHPSAWNFLRMAEDRWRRLIPGASFEWEMQKYADLLMKADRTEAEENEAYDLDVMLYGISTLYFAPIVVAESAKRTPIAPMHIECKACRTAKMPCGRPFHTYWG